MDIGLVSLGFCLQRVVESTFKQSSFSVFPILDPSVLFYERPVECITSVIYLEKFARTGLPAFSLMY